MYHISDLKKYNSCPKMYYLSLKEETNYNPYLRNDGSMVELLSDYFQIQNKFVGVRNDSSERFFKEKDKYEWFFNVRLEDGEMRVKIPLMHKIKDRFEVYFTLFKTNNKELDLFSLRVNIEVLEKLKVKIDEVYVIYLNPNYVFHEKLNVKELFILSSDYRGERLRSEIKKQYVNYQKIISSIIEDENKEIESLKTRTCRLKNACGYYDTCFGSEKDLPDDNILTLVSSQFKNQMYLDGITCLKDIDLERFEGNRVQYAQIQASKNGGLFVDKPALKMWLNSFSLKPVSFIDFEWDRYLIPVYEGMKPMDVMCFEFALYYLDENNNLEHRTFIGTNDCRREFVEALLYYLPKEGPIIAYNAIGAEVLRIKELMKVFPEYKNELSNIASRFVDLAVPFNEGIVYDTRMRGNFTVKKLVSVVSDYSYDNFDVKDGMEAVYSWRDVDKGLCDTPDKVFGDLDKYCSLDAYSLFLVYKWLLEKALT